MSLHVCYSINTRLFKMSLIKRTFNPKNLKLCLSFFSNSHRQYLVGFVPVIPCIYAESNIKEIKDNKPCNVNDNASVSQTNNETGWDRVKAIFQKDEYGQMSKELLLTVNAMCMSCLVGFVYGGIDRGRVAFQDFMERNQASIFESPIDAKRKLQNHVTIHFGKGAAQYAWRLSFFTGGFVLLLTTLHAYRGSTNVMDYVLSGAAIGGLSRIKFGPPAIIVGGGLGGILGLFCGLAATSMFSLTGLSYDDILAYQYEADRKRQSVVNDAIKAKLDKSQVPEEIADTLKYHENMKPGI